MCVQNQACDANPVEILWQYWDWPEGEGEDVEFTLVYEGELLAEREDRAHHKHAIRKQLHPQLKELWRLRFPHWLNSSKPSKGSPGIFAGKVRRDEIANNYNRCGYRFVPLVIEELALACKLDILFLRPGLALGKIVQGGDLDNRLKTLFDGLRVPRECKEIGGHLPAPDENPFYCLLQDDILITEVKIRADTLLVSEAKQNDAKVIIGVTLRPVHAAEFNADF